MSSSFKIEHRQLGKGYVTVAFDYDTDNELIHYALSFCSPLDQFSRKRGNLIAQGRLVAYVTEGHGHSNRNMIGRDDKLIRRGLAGSISANAEPKKKAVIDNVISIIVTRKLDDSQLRWLDTAVSSN